MLNRIKAAISDFLHIHPEEGVPEQVAMYFKHNVFVNLPLYFYRMSLSAGYEGRSIWMPEDQEEAI